MMLFRFPTLQLSGHRIMLWGVERSWTNLGRWDHAPILWQFEKALQETRFDRESTKLHPVDSNSGFASDILASLKKASSSLRKLHSREIDLYCLAKLKGEGDQYFLEGICPTWIKLLQIKSSSDHAGLRSLPSREWFSQPLNEAQDIFVVRHDIAETPHQLELLESSTCRYEPLAEWLSCARPMALSFSTEEKAA